MSKHRIVCVEHAQITGHAHHAHHQHTHIIGAGTSSDPSHIERRWRLDEILTAMRAGDIFYTQGETSHKVAEVEHYHCEKCGGTHIKTKPDHVKDNNLDELKHCPVTPVKPTRDRDDRKPQPDRRHG